ncbi:MAG: pilus assembly protein [Ignavibacteriales bacterium CG18_big_fil_WC_8_21_14_2_50_31_20]|nr:MAG: pilus assembly protein [Ignavibacteriales bacterium CG18_big_fil_WC_8_21_14_2_50_31_20]
MQIIDANVVLRYLLKDDEALFGKAVKIIESNNVQLTNVIIAEIVYIFEKVYKIPKREISFVLKDFFALKTIHLTNKKLMTSSLDFYYEYNIDFADAILLSYSKVENHEVFTFDKKLNKLLTKMKRI